MLFTVPPVRSFDVILAHGTPKDATFNVVADLWRDVDDWLEFPAISTKLEATTATMALAGAQYALQDNNMRIGVELDNGVGALDLYVYVNCNVFNPIIRNLIAVHKFNFTIAEPDTGGDPDPQDVVSISIDQLPQKTTYFEGDVFDDAGMVVKAVKKNGDVVEILGYQFPTGALSLSDTKVTISFGTHSDTLMVTVLPVADISEVSISNGQMYDEWERLGFLQYKKKTVSFDAVALYGQQNGKFSFRASEGAEVYVGDVRQEVSDEDGLYHLDLPAGNIDGHNGATSIVTVKAGGKEKNYAFRCFAQRHNRMPSRVEEYLCIASQYTNGQGLGGWGMGVAPFRTLIGNFLTGPASDWPDNGAVSLGNFGGYIVYSYNEPITDDPKNPYGVDFIVYGNSHNPERGFAEPGNVLVSESKDGPWYTLAGSAHYEDYAKWNHSVTYTNQNGIAHPTRFSYPQREYYSLFPWTAETAQSITLTGVWLSESDTDAYGSLAASFPEFGYADTGLRNEDEEAGNPYIGFDTRGWRTTNDGFDLKWAVNSITGQPVDLSSAEIRYVKIQTANFVDAGAIGEKSTEIYGVRVAKPETSNVGKTPLPTPILVDGVAVHLQAGTDVYGNVKVNPGAFTVNVAAPEGANIYINGVRGAGRTFGKMPDHEMLRVIVQEGQKEPAIVYMNLEVDETKQPVIPTKVTFDSDGGSQVNDKYLTQNTPEDEWGFPTPTKSTYTITEGMTEFDEPEALPHTFLGWYDSDGKKYTGEYSEKEDILEHGTLLALTARWEAPNLSETTITTASLAGGITGVAYKATLTATGGTAPYTWAKTSGTLPDGLTLSTAGVISGTPTKAEKFTFSVSATDATGSADEASLTITITAADAPGKPTSLKAEPGNGSVALTWGAPASDGGSAITKYEVKIGDAESWATATDKSHVFSSLTNGTLYTFSVRAVNVKGAGEAATVTARPVAANAGQSEESTNSVYNGNNSGGLEHAVVIDATATVVVEDGVKTAVPQAVTATDIKEAIDKAADAGGTAKPVIVINATGAKAVKVEETVKALAAVDDTEVSIPVVLDDGVITLNSAVAKKLEEAAEKAGEDLNDETLKLVIIPDVEKDTDDETLTPEQADAITSDKEVRVVYDVSAYAGDTKLEIDDLTGEAKLTVELHYTLDTKAGEKPSGVLVKYFRENGETERMTDGRKYDTDDELAMFRTSHLSIYAVTYDPSLVQDTETVDTENDDDQKENYGSNGGGGCGAGNYGMILLLAFAAVAILRRKAA
ncbi:MAG: putative Ig domain-containing protein [Synergistaceae bacterium]|nr:putative Ig domain-containing protein [Synergistaceae bacterium]